MSSRLVWSAANWQMQGWGTCVCVCVRICSSILSLIWLNVCLFLGANPLFLSYWLQMHYWLGYLLHVELPFSFCINNAGKRCVLEEGRCSEMIDGRLFDFNALSLGCSLAAPAGDGNHLIPPLLPLPSHTCVMINELWSHHQQPSYCRHSNQCILIVLPSW